MITYAQNLNNSLSVGLNNPLTTVFSEGGARKEAIEAAINLDYIDSSSPSSLKIAEQTSHVNLEYKENFAFKSRFSRNFGTPKSKNITAFFSNITDNIKAATSKEYYGDLIKGYSELDGKTFLDKAGNVLSEVGTNFLDPKTSGSYDVGKFLANSLSQTALGVGCQINLKANKLKLLYLRASQLIKIIIDNGSKIPQDIRQIKMSRFGTRANTGAPFRAFFKGTFHLLTARLKTMTVVLNPCPNIKVDIEWLRANLVTRNDLTPAVKQELLDEFFSTSILILFNLYKIKPTTAQLNEGENLLFSPADLKWYYYDQVQKTWMQNGFLNDIIPDSGLSKDLKKALQSFQSANGKNVVDPYKILKARLDLLLSAADELNELVIEITKMRKDGKLVSITKPPFTPDLNKKIGEEIDKCIEFIFGKDLFESSFKKTLQNLKKLPKDKEILATLRKRLFGDIGKSSKDTKAAMGSYSNKCPVGVYATNDELSTMIMSVIVFMRELCRSRRNPIVIDVSIDNLVGKYMGELELDKKWKKVLEQEIPKVINDVKRLINYAFNALNCADLLVSEVNNLAKDIGSPAKKIVKGFANQIAPLDEIITATPSDPALAVEIEKTQIIPVEETPNKTEIFLQTEVFAD